MKTDISTEISLKEKLKGMLICGAIGDAIGGKYEGTEVNLTVDFDFNWNISDDTQLTLATCEAIQNSEISPEIIADNFLKWFLKNKLSGLGASTLQALKGLQVGGHWALVGRTGDFAAGNGAAMRIAPLSFKKNVTKMMVKDVCNITHKNDGAYSGALAIYTIIQTSLTTKLNKDIDLLQVAMDGIFDSNTKDRLIEIQNNFDGSIINLGKKYRPSGYVVDSVPTSIYAANLFPKNSFKEILSDLILIGGDTDTTCSMTGQILGAIYGTVIIPDDLMAKYYELNIDDEINTIVNNWKE